MKTLWTNGMTEQEAREVIEAANMKPAEKKALLQQVLSGSPLAQFALVGLRNRQAK